MLENKTLPIPPRPKSGFDPVVLVLIVLIAGGVIAGLAFFAAGLGRGLLGQTAPQNYRQAKLTQATFDAATYSDKPDAWYKYIKQLAFDKQFSKAQEIIKEADRNFRDTDTYDFYIPSAQAYVYFAKGDFDSAIKQAITAQAAMQAAYETELKSKKLPNKALSNGISENYGSLSLLLSGAYTEKGEHAKAAEVLERYVDEHPTEAGVWTDLGNAYAKMGENKKAIDAYDQTLRFINDDPEALAGKAKLTGEKK